MIPSMAKIFNLTSSTNSNDSKIWTLVFDLPGEKVNKLSREVMAEFDGLLPRLEEMGGKKEIDALILVSGKEGNFIAGADIEMLQTVKTSEEGQALSRMGHQLMNRWEDLPFPTIAAVDGAALGGGCEFALSCTAIVMSNSPGAKIGLPEVMLGLIPGMGGCVRLPRKIGLAQGFDLILTGKTLNGERAVRAGLVEACLPKEDFENSARRWVKANRPALCSGKRLAKEPKLGGMGGPIGTVMEKTPLGRMVIFKKAREGVQQKTRGHYPAPLEAIDVIHSWGGTYGPKLRGKQRERALEREAQGFGLLAVSPVARNLIRIFFMTEAVKKSRGLPSGVTAESQSVNSAAVLGAGVMGGGIAQLLADRGIVARMKDLTHASLVLGVQAASKIFQKQVQRKKINKRQYLQKVGLISPTLDYSGFGSADLVVEAIVENLDIKKKALQELEEQVSDRCVIASNTSSLSITAMQSGLKNPERFGGLHFFNPVHRMPLIEVIRGEKTSDATVTSLFQFSKRLGKTPVVVKDAPGFLVNRLLMPYLNEATYLLAEGVPIEDLDRVLLDFGMPMGPMELIDEVGVDVGEKVAHILHAAFGDRMMPSPVNGKVAATGRLGKKNGKGLYEYGPQGRDKKLNPEIYGILGIQPQSGKVADEEILERCILPMINEASRCLEEGIVTTAEDVDLGMIMGTGFPPFRGGLLCYADTLGARTLVDRLKKYEAHFGKRFELAPALLKRAETGAAFYTR